MIWGGHVHVSESAVVTKDPEKNKGGEPRTGAGVHFEKYPEVVNTEIDTVNSKKKADVGVDHTTI